jgi:hypothetical protein
VGSELRLLLAGGRVWEWLIFLGVVVAGFVAPLETAKGPILALAWIVPLVRWSGLGARERMHATSGFVFPAPHYVPRQVLAAWAAGALLALLSAAGVVVRLALAGDGAGLVAVAAGALFVPAFALALGTLSGTVRLFEILYALLWYLGPIQHLPALDFTGATPGAQPAVWLALAAAGVVTATAARAAQVRG